MHMIALLGGRGGGVGGWFVRLSECGRGRFAYCCWAMKTFRSNPNGRNSEPFRRNQVETTFDVYLWNNNQTWNLFVNFYLNEIILLRQLIRSRRFNSNFKLIFTPLNPYWVAACLFACIYCGVSEPPRN